MDKSSSELTVLRNTSPANSSAVSKRYSTTDHQVLDYYRKDFGEDVAEKILRECQLLAKFTATVKLLGNDQDLLNLVNASHLSVDTIPHYYVLSHRGRTPYLLEMLNSLNKGLIRGLMLIRDHPLYQQFKGLHITALAYDQLCWHFPTTEKLQFIKDAVGDRRVLEVGCGRGLVTVLLSGMGIDIVATDSGEWSDHKDNNNQGIYFTHSHRLDNRAAVEKYGSDRSSAVYGSRPSVSKSHPGSETYCPVLLACWAIADIPWDDFAGDLAIIIGNKYACEGYPNPNQWALVSSFAGAQWGTDKMDPDTIDCYRRLW